MLARLRQTIARVDQAGSARGQHTADLARVRVILAALGLWVEMIRESGAERRNLTPAETRLLGAALGVGAGEIDATLGEE